MSHDTKPNHPPQQRDADALGRRLAADAEAIQQPLSATVRNRVLAQLDAEAAPLPLGHRRRPAALAAAGAGLLAAAVLLAVTVNWFGTLPGDDAMVVNETDAPEVQDAQFAALPSVLPTWENLQLVDQPWEQEADYMVQDTLSVGRFLLARSAVPVEF